MRLLLPSALIFYAGSAFAQTAPDTVVTDALRIVESHAIAFTAPAKRIPTDKMVDGPLLGNGDLGVTIAGTPDALRFHIGKNDFWGKKTQSPQTVGRVELLAPALAGAPYKAVGDMRRGTWLGEFAKDGVALRLSALVDANANRLIIAVENTGTKPADFSLRLVKGAADSVPGQVGENGAKALAGCEQAGGRRWFFKGAMSDLVVRPAILTDAGAAALTTATPGGETTFDGKTAREIEAPAMTDRVTVSARIRIDDTDKEANYIVSKGEWNKAYSLGLSAGKLRFTAGGAMLQTDEALPKNKWIHVAGTLGGGRMALFVDGKPVKQLGVERGEGLAFLHEPDGAGPGVRRVAVAARILGTNEDTVTLAPGEKRTVAAVVLSDLDLASPASGNPLPEAKAQVAALTPEKVAECVRAHRAWWENFWKKSFVEIPDKVIEQHWYSAQYILASCSRAGKVAPGLWGNWITMDKTAWHGDFHLNYNFQAPYYSAYSSNRPEVSLPFYDAMNESIPRGRRIAVAHGWKGIHFPVSIGPWGMCPEGDDSDWGQHSNAAYSALLYGMYWRSTYDKAWLAKTGYPYMREVGKFWTGYLKLENGRYVIEHESIHEGSGGAGRSGVSSDFNPIFSLGLVRALYRDMLDMSEALGADAELRPKWRDILEKISAFPTQEKNGKTVFRYTEKGTAWWGDNTVGIQHIYPAGAIGLDSDPKLLEISRNMLTAMGRWQDNNGSSSWYAACARVGYEPEKCLVELRKMYDRHSMPNKIPNFGGGGIENVSPAAAVNEMLFQSHEGVLRFFPSWPKTMNARFGTLRADGAFLVSAELRDGVVSGVSILSERGRDCVVVNPWPGKKVRVTRNGTAGETVSGERFTLKTSENETLALAP